MSYHFQPMNAEYSSRLEASVTQSILTQLANLGWVVDERDPKNNVTQQRPKTKEEKKKLQGKPPDFVLYEENSNNAIGIIEARRPGRSLNEALNDAERKYAKPLGVPLIFGYNDTYVATRYLANGHSLKIDGEDVRQFIDHYTALRFVREGAEILSAPPQIQHSREQLIKIFRRAADLLREAGLQAGLERFGAFSDILFLKIMDEMCELRKHAGLPPPVDEHIRWTHFQEMPRKELHTYLKNVVWKYMNDKYGSIFSESLPIDSAEILQEIVAELSALNLTSADSDVKGDAFEYFLKNAYQGLSIKDLGEYFTPRNIVRTMVSMVNPVIGEKIYDPFCGTGGFLIESFKYISIRMKPNAQLLNTLRNDTVYGSELTSNARIAKMNMILFGDGHNNVLKQDTFANPVKDKYDVVLTNPPYSQPTRYGNLYPVPTSNGDAISILHCFESLKDSGRMAILVKEDFLSEGGAVGKTREYILNKAKNFSVTSLPRKLFIPYTPTKTNIIYFEKDGKRNTTFFYVVRNVGHTLVTRKKTIPQNDLPVFLDSFKGERDAPELDSCIVENEVIRQTNHSLWVYDYIELFPDSRFNMEYLGDWIEPSGEKVEAEEFLDDEEYIILGVSNKLGITENDPQLGQKIRQPYQRVRVGDLVYNPHRVNVGSIGLVPKELENNFMPYIYVVFRSKNQKRVPPEYILLLLKSKPYIRVIEAYDTKHGAVRANLTYDQLCRIRIPILNDKEMERFVKKQKELSVIKNAMKKKEKEMTAHLKSITSDVVNPHHLEDFNALLKKAILNDSKVN